MQMPLLERFILEPGSCQAARLRQQLASVLEQIETVG